MPKIVTSNQFVLRQTKDSPFAHFTGSWEQLEILVEANLDKAVQGYKSGVKLVPLNPEGFFSSITLLTKETKLKPEFKPRRPGEDSFVHVYAIGGKVPAKRVDIVIYSHEVLGKEASSNTPYEIISINASPSSEEVPMDPVTMMRNFLERPGGTKGEFSAEDFAKSIFFWSQHALVTAE